MNMVRREPVRQKLILAVGCLMATMVCWRSVLQFEGTEFGGGSLAGDEGIGGLLFLVVPILAFKYSRTAAIVGLIACFVSLPLFLYLVFPRPFRLVWPGQWKVLTSPLDYFVFDGWWIAGIFAIAVVGYICCRGLIRGVTLAERPVVH
jgi:hypothetical protein